MLNSEFQQKIQSGNPIDLLTNVKLLELADMIFEDNFDDSSSEAVEQGATATEEPEKTLYKWIDKNGRVHFSDKSPK